MNRIFYLLVFCVGLAVAAWVGAGYLGSNLLALAVTGLIVAAYSFGGLELFRFRRATDTLDAALDDLAQDQADADRFLAKVDPTLRDVVRLRVEGERVGLPGPSMTPYLVGLLVLLGMLGTFLGLVATLRGTGLALEQASDLQAIRASLAAPVKGLGFAFGSSVAGVAASAMLGLMAALSRRDRVRAGRRLDAAVATTLHVFSRAFQRDQGFQLMQQQAQALPLVAERLQTMIEALDQRSLEIDQQFRQRSLDLVGQLQKSLAENMAQTGQLVGEVIQPVVESTFAGLARESTALHSAIQQSAEQQLESLSSRFEQSNSSVAAVWTEALAQHQRANESLAQTFEQRSASMVDGVAARLEDVSTRLSGGWSDALLQQQQTSEKLADANQQALSQAIVALEQRCSALTTQMRESVSENMARDNAMLEERGRLLETVSTLLDAVNHASSEQRTAVDAMVSNASSLLDRLGTQVIEKVEDQASKLGYMASQVTGSAIEMAGLGDTFGKSVQSFSESNAVLVEQLQRIEQALDKTLVRSDEQLAYYVAQAREVIDLSMLSQKQILEELQRSDAAQIKGSSGA